MKHILPTILLITYALLSSAAPLGKKQNTQHVAMYSAILNNQKNASPANKTTGIQRRLIANSYVANGVLTDTNHYYYSNGRGSSHSGVTSYYDEFYITAIEPVKNIFCDSSSNWYFYSGNLTKTGTRAYNYDATPRITYMTSRSYSSIVTYLPSYNSSGKLEVITMTDTVAPVPASKATSRMYIFYDSQNRRASDSTVNLKTNMPSGKRVYVYSATGNRLQFNSYEYNAGTWELTYRNVNSYDISNRLITSSSELDFGLGGGLEFTNKDSFVYAGTNTQPSYHIDYDWDGTAWIPNEITLSQYNAANLLDTYYIIRYTTQWDTIERDAYTYDTNNLLLRNNGYKYNGNGTFSTTPYDQSTMYYEDHFPTVILANTANANTIRMYPNPAKDCLSIENLDASALNICDMQGRRVYEQEGLTGTSSTISLQQLPAGNYILNLFDTGGVHIAQKQFIKQ